jgi:hypothetical protein
VTLDGTEYYRSEKHFCAQCHRVKQRNGKVGYKHLVLTSALVKPGERGSVGVGAGVYSGGGWGEESGE